jgi:hypothetical protein
LSDGSKAFTGDIDEVAVYAGGSSISDQFALGRKTDAVTDLTTRTGYDRLGRPVDTWAPDLVRTRAVYDRLGDQTETIANYVDGTYRFDGTLATQTFPSSLTETLAYDAAKRPTSISLGSAGSLTQAFDRAGNVEAEERSLSGISGDPG